MSKLKPFTKSIKGKIIIASVFACIALFLAWGTSKLAFEEMLSTVENISAPSEKLRIVNSLSLKIIGLDQLQKSQISNKSGDRESFLKESEKLSLSIDTLSKLYLGDTTQLERIASVKSLLKERDQLFINYLQVREGFLNSDLFTQQLQSVNNLVEENSRKTDSTIRQSEKRTLTTTIYNLENKPKQEEQRGFLSKLFGKKRADEQQKDPGFNIINEELNVKFDTVELAKQDSILKDLGQTMRSIERAQRLKSERFLDKEAVLSTTGDLLINEMLDILREVEREAVRQIEKTSFSAKEVVNSGIKQISIIMLVFFFVTIILLYLILTDITKNNEYRKALEIAKDEAEYHGKAKQRFLSNMSHEIRTPLQSIIGYSERIRNQNNPSKKDIDAIFYSSEHLMQIVNEILDYNRIVSGKLTFSSEIFKIEDLLNEVIAVMKLQASKKGIKLFTDFNLEDAIYIEGDSFRLKQILYNLIGNAVKFTEKGYVALGVSCKKHNHYLHFIFTIEDTGIGMSDVDLKHIFNEFEQAPSGNKSINQQGAGLGLSIAKTLVESQGGRINVRSKIDEGSTFTVYLRFLAVDESEKEIISNPKEAYLDNFNKKIWVVDDDPFILDLCAMILENKGISHQCFNSPLDLLEEEWDDEVKYILTDLRMPEMSGTELCQLLKKRIPADVKVIALTAQVLHEEREKVLQSGFDGLLIKPFKEEQLLSLFDGKIDTTPINEINFDKNFLSKMTLGDEEQLDRILKQFIADTLNDKEELAQALLQNDKETTSLIVHRIAGRTAQIGAREIAAEFRKMEIELAEKDLDEPVKLKIESLLEKLITNLT